MINIINRVFPDWRLHSRQFLMFGMVGVWNTIVDLTVYTIAVIAGVHPAWSNIIAFAVTNPISYFINSRTTFRRGGVAAKLSASGYGKFLGAHLISLALSTATVYFLTPKLGPFLAKFCAIAITVVINYGASALLVFRHEPAPADQSED